MNKRLSRRIFISQMLFSIAACAGTKTVSNQKLVVGIISYGEEKQTLDRLSSYRQYLSDKLKIVIEIEPAFNERIAIERMERRSWSLVFATPGLAAMGIANYQYWPMFSLQLGSSSRSIIVVNKSSPVKQVKDLQGRKMALGLPGSATGYYLPLFNLYGLTLASVKFAATPLMSLELLSKGEVNAAALSLQEFNLYKTKINSSQFRILFRDIHNVPSGSVICSPLVERKRADLIRNHMKKAPTSIIQEARYIPNAQPPDYQYMMSVVKKVDTISENINSQPVRLFN